MHVGKISLRAPLYSGIVKNCQICRIKPNFDILLHYFVIIYIRMPAESQSMKKFINYQYIKF